MTVKWCAGLDLAQSIDFSALAVAELKDHKLIVRHLYRWERGTSYPAIIEDLHKLYSRPPLAGSPLIVDATGVGRGVTDFLRANRVDAHIVSVTITSGFLAARTKGYFSTPKQ